MWLYGTDLEYIEAGASNIFILWKRKDGRKELIAAPFDDKLILDGITRRSCLELAHETQSNNIVITERKYSINRVIEADSKGRILGAFAAGTTVSTLTIKKMTFLV